MPSDIRDKSSPLYEILVLMLKQTKKFEQSQINKNYEKD